MNRSRRIHKRPFVTFLCVLAVVGVLSGYFLISMGALGGGADLPAVRVSANELGSRSLGIGLNVSELPVNNFVRNPSFENSELNEFFLIEGYQGNKVYVLPKNTSDRYVADDFFTGGSIRVLAFSEQVISRKLETTVTDYRINQPGLWSSTELPGVLPVGFALSAIASSSNTTVAVGSGGYIVSDVMAAVPVFVELEFEGDWVDCIAGGDRFFALAADGSLAVSSNGRTWSLTENTAVSGFEFASLAAIDRSCIAVGERGMILQYLADHVRLIPVDTRQNLRAVGSDGNVVLVAGERGTLLSSVNGSVFRALSDAEIPDGGKSVDWVDVTVKGNLFLLAGARGEVAVGRFSALTNSFSFSAFSVTDESGSPVLLQSIEQTANGVLLALDTRGNLYCSSDGALSWARLDTSESGVSDLLFVSSEDKIVLASDRFCYLTQLYTEISFKSDQEDIDINRGDMLFLGIDEQTEATGDSFNQWEIYGESAEGKVVGQAPTGGGHSSFLLSGAGEGEHFISQVISTKQFYPLQTQEFYRLDIWLRQNRMKDSDVLVWMTGGFENVGTRFSNVGNGWRQYTYIFTISQKSEFLDEKEQRVNIGFRGTGDLYIDKVELRASAEAERVYDQKYFVEPLREAAPEYIRLENLRIGVGDTSGDSWYLGGGNDGILTDRSGNVEVTGVTDLSQSLQLVKDVGANPWIVIDSMTTLRDVRNILAYLCGSFADEYGSYRIAAGKAAPWSKDFERIVFEITDTNGIFSADLQKGAFVNYIKAEIESSFSVYRELRDKAVFVDGMSYSGGLMTSGADFHCGDLNMELAFSGEGEVGVKSFLSKMDEAYSVYYDGIPRILTDPLLSGSDSSVLLGEWIRSGSLRRFRESDAAGKTRVSVSAAEYASFFLYDLGMSTTGLLADISIAADGRNRAENSFFSEEDSAGSISVANGKTILNVLSLLGDAVQGVPLEVIVPETGAVTAENVSATDQLRNLEGVQGFAFQNGDEITLIFTNLSAQARLFRLEGEYSFKGAELSQYADNGAFLESAQMNRRQNRINILPGQVVVVRFRV